MNPTSKPIRVMDTDYDVGKCPVCYERIVGTLTVEVHLGDLTMVDPESPDQVAVEVGTTTRLRNLVVRHECAPRLVGS